MANIQERLDRGFRNWQWRTVFSQAFIQHLLALKSNHKPLLLNTLSFTFLLKKPFQFESMWTRESSMVEVIALAKNLRNIKQALKNWNRYCFGNIHAHINSLKSTIEYLQESPTSPENLCKEHLAQSNLNDILKREGLMWTDKSRSKWMIEGDCNAGFFHITSIIYHRNNSINYFKLVDGNWSSDHSYTGNEFVHYFANMFTTSTPNFLDNLNNLINSSISGLENDFLWNISCFEEIRSSAFMMNLFKSPGPNGFNPFFFKNY